MSETAYLRLPQFRRQSHELKYVDFGKPIEFKIPPKFLKEMQHILVSDICTFFGREKEVAIEYQFSPGPIKPSKYFQTAFKFAHPIYS